MHDTKTVDRAKERALKVVSTKYPAYRVSLLEAVQRKRGDAFMSETIRAALDVIIESHFPGSTTDRDNVWDRVRAEEVAKRKGAA